MNSLIRLFTLVIAPTVLAACAITHTSKSNYSNGRPRVVYEYTFNDDGREVLHGTYQEWSEDGQLKVRGELEHGVRHGTWTYFHSNGKKWSSGRYKENRRVGEWSFWTQQGELHARVTYPGLDGGKMTREYHTPPAEPFRGQDGKPVRVCSKENIRAVAETFSPQIRHCFEVELQKDPSLSGKIVMQWKQGPHGEVLSPSVIETTMKNRAVEVCLEGVIARMQFLPPEKGDFCTINYPLVFSGVN